MTRPAPRGRIVVALDSSAHARAAMETAGELARRLRAEVLALFVEDADLLRLASLPFAREIGSDALARPFDTPRLERRLRSEAREARALCASIAERLRMQVRFEVARGAVAREILSAAEQADMIVLGRASAAPLRTAGRLAPRRATPLGRTTLSVLTSCTRTVAIVPAEPSAGRPVAVVYDGSEPSRRALDLAVRLAGEDHHNLVVLIPAGGEPGRQLRDDAASIAQKSDLVPRFLLLSDARDLADAVSRTDCRAVVLDRSSACVAAGGGVLALVERLACPVFVVG